MSVVLTIDDYDGDEAMELVADFGCDRYGYLVTPNVDHVIRFYDDVDFRTLYQHASYVLLDSRFLAHVLGLIRRQSLRVCLGSDLTNSIFCSLLKVHDVAVLVGGTVLQAQQLRERFGLKFLRHIDPPMNLIADRKAMEECVAEIERLSPFRFCFLAVGSPQQEMIARRLQERGIARGLALCVGASINYMTGTEKRASPRMQKLGLEWLYRLLQDPKRLGRRYLVRGPRIFLLLSQMQLRLRRPVTLPRTSRLSANAVAATALTESREPSI